MYECILDSVKIIVYWNDNFNISFILIVRIELDQIELNIWFPFLMGYVWFSLELTKKKKKLTNTHSD